MISCPNKGSKDWSDLINKVGENKAYLLWNEYKGEVPDEFYEENKEVDNVETIVNNLESKRSSSIDSAIEKFYSMQDEKTSLSKSLIDDFNSRDNDSINATERKIELLQKGLNAEVIVDASIKESGMLLPANHPLTLKYGKPVIVINPNLLFSDTVIHEFGHLYIDLLSEHDGVLNNAYELLRGTEFYNQIAKQYPELTSKQLDKEVLATAIGLSGDKIFKDSLKNLSAWQKIKNYLISVLQKMFNMSPNSIEQLAREMLTGNVRLTGAEMFNSTIAQRSKFVVDPESKDKKEAVLDVLDRITKRFTKETIDGENIYRDSENEGKPSNNSVTKDIDQYRKRVAANNKGDYTMVFNRSLVTKENILLQLNQPRIPSALARALDDLINDSIINTEFSKGEAKDWFSAYQNEMDEDALIQDLKKKRRSDFESILIDNFDIVMTRAEEHQLSNDQAPLAGNIVHDIIETYINDRVAGKETVFPKNIKDKDMLLIKAIKKIVDAGLKNGSSFRTEQILYSESRQLPGTADLIEVTKSGEVKIYDYKTMKAFKKNGINNTGAYSLHRKGYMHQLLTYGAMLRQSNINLADDPFHIVAIEISYSNVEDLNSNIEISDVKTISLSDKDSLTLLNRTRNQIFNRFASPSQLKEINIKADIQDLSDLVTKIKNDIDVYNKVTKGISSSLDTSNIKQIANELRNQKDLEASLDKYVAKNNQVVIKAYVDNIHKALATLESQKDSMGDSVSSDYLQSLNYVLQATDALGAIKSLMEEKDDLDIDDAEGLMKIIDNTSRIVDNNKSYYREKLKRVAISQLSAESNLMEGFYVERFKIEANKRKLKGDEKTKYVLENIKAEEENIKIKEINYWTKQYEDGFADIRAMEYWLADPGINKSQFVQLVKNIQDKADMSIRNKMMDIVPDIAKWHKDLKFEKTGDPKKVWGDFLETRLYTDYKTKESVTELAGSVIPEFISDYRKMFMKYENNLINREKNLREMQLVSNKSEDFIKKINELKKEILDLKKERQEQLAKASKDEDFKKLRVNPQFEKLSEDKKDALRFIHKQLIEADERLYISPEKKLGKALEDGSYIHYLPRQRMGTIEAASRGNTLITRFKSKLEDMIRPPADEDEMNIEEGEFSNESRSLQADLDLSGQERFSIPVYYRNELEDISLQSYDIPSLLVENHETTVHFENAKTIEADLFVITESLSSVNNSKILKTDSFVNKKIKNTIGGNYQKSDQNLVYQAVKSSIDNRLYKRSYKGVYSKNNYKLIKAGEAISKYASTLVLTGNFMSALATFSQGSIYRFIEASVGENITIEDWKKGTSKAWADFPNMLKDTQRFVASSKSNLLINKFGLETQARALTNKFVQDNFAKKNLDSATLFSVTSMAEAVVTSTLMYSLLNNIKVTNSEGEFIDKSGKVVEKEKAMSLDEAYTVKDGKLVLDKGVTYTSFNITKKYNDGLNKDNTTPATEISRYIRSVYADLYGQYNQDMKSVLQRHIAGKMMMSLRGWLPRGINRRWRGITDVLPWNNDYMSFDELRNESNIDKRFYSQDQKQFQEGHYTTSIRFIRMMIKEMKGKAISYDIYMKTRGNIKETMSDHEIANLKRSIIEIALILSMTAISMLLRVIAMNSEGDDEDKQKIYFAAYLAERIRTELATFVSVFEMFEMMKSPAASMNVIEKVGGWATQLVGFAYSKEEGFNWNVNDVYESGSKEDLNKAWVKTLGLIPGKTKWEQLISIFGIESTNPIEDSYKYSIKKN